MLDATPILDGSLLPALAVALLGGVLSFLSPCVLPIVPPYLAYMGGVTVEEIEGRGRSRAVMTSAFFVLGLSTVFLLLGAAASAMGRALLAWQGWLVAASGLAIMVFGAHFLGVLRLPFLAREARLDAGDRGGSAFGAYVLGLAFAFGWTPCLGPVLAAILSLAAGSGDPWRGAALLAVYAAGLGLPFLLVAAFFTRLAPAMHWMKRRLDWIERASGLLLWTVGLMMLTGQFTAFSFWLLEHAPWLATVG